VYEFRGNKVVVINGKQTGRLEVSTTEITGSAVLPVTGLERTLIDVTVRPAYAGGVLEVMAAFRAARGRLNVARMLEVLERLEYVYPYHQVIGFYLSRAGFPDDELNQLRRLGNKFAFYATYGMKQPKFNPEWQVYYPEELDFSSTQRYHQRVSSEKSAHSCICLIALRTTSGTFSTLVSAIYNQASMNANFEVGRGTSADEYYPSQWLRTSSISSCVRYFSTFQ
jgi:hypothetical protein